MHLLIRLKVKDYAKWKTVFDERQPLRVQHGAKRHWLHRSADDGNEVVISIEFPSVEAARGYADDPSLREAMARAGVQGPPTFVFMDDVESVAY